MPWLLYTIITFKPVAVDSMGVGCSVSLLFLMLVFVFLAIVAFRFVRWLKYKYIYKGSKVMAVDKA